MTIFKKPVFAGLRRKDPDQKKPARRKLDVGRVALGVAATLLLSILFSLHLLPDKVSLQVGDVSEVQRRAHRTVRYVDSVETERLREEAVAGADKVYTIVPRSSAQAVESVSSLFEVLRRARNDSSLDGTSRKAAWVRRNLRWDFPDGALHTLLTIDSAAFNQMASYTRQVAGEVMDREIRDDTDDVRAAREEFRRRVGNFFTSRDQIAAAESVANGVIRPNRLYDPDRTRSARERERLAVQPRQRQVLAGEIIIDKGERVTPEHMDKFLALGLRQPHVDYVSVLCISLLVALVVMFTIAYLARYYQSVYRSTRMMLLLAIIVVSSSLGLKLVGSMLGLSFSGVQYGYFMMIWIATAAMLTAILINPSVAVLVVAFLAGIAGVAMNYELRFVAASIFSSVVAVYAVSDIRNRSDYIRAGLYVCLANLAMVWLVGVINGDQLKDLTVGSGWAVIGGMISIGIFGLGTTALEKPFGITTHIRLLELLDTNHPILRRLLMEAPGTYSHSVFVGNIAATAAEVIGADPLLVRVASYYHDVGKMRRPHFFVENQHVENIHDRLNPSLSALVIRSHIKDGLDLALEYRLPPAVCELMSQHHGTSLVRYFYQKAEEESGVGSTVLEHQFRYEGTKPQTKEAALLMLADSVEAASRALAKPDIGSIKDMVRKILDERLSDGQLDESELTFKDISRITESFVRTLTSMLHARIEYPDPPGSEPRRPGSNGNTDKEPAVAAGEPGKPDQSREQVVAG